MWSSGRENGSSISQRFVWLQHVDIISHYKLTFTRLVICVAEKLLDSNSENWCFKAVLLFSCKSCSTLGDSMDYSSPSSSVHGILQARILEWVAISFSISFSIAISFSILKKAKCKKTKWLSQKTLKIAKKRREAKEKRRDILIWMESSKD